VTGSAGSASVLAYLMSRFPMLTETFFLDEILEMEYRRRRMSHWNPAGASSEVASLGAAQ
jgi:hypothetical protein